MNDGSKDIIAQIERLKSGLPAAVQEGCQEWADQEAAPLAKRLVPVLTGATQESIGAAAGPGGVTLFATTHYADIIEHGDSQRGAKPFLLPAIRQTLPRLGAHIARALDKRK